MGQESLFGGKGDDARRVPEDEGIRIIPPDEAAEVAEREDAAQRRGDGIPRYGDRPPPPGGPRPALRFPLADSDDPTEIERLQVAPVAARTAPGSHEPLAATGDEGDEGDEGPPARDDVELPHWTEPPTGEVPEVVISEFAEGSEARAAASASGPRWRGDAPADWDEADDLSDLIDDASRIGALAPAPAPDEPTHDEYLAFDDLDDLSEPVRPVSAAGDDAGEGAAGEPAVKKIATTVTKKAASTPSAGSAPSGGQAVKARPARRASGPPAPGVPTPPERSGDGGGGGEGGGERDLGLSVAAGAMIGVLALFLFWLGANVGAFFVVLMVLPIVVLSALELFHAFGRADYHPATLLGWVACGGMVLGACWRGDSGIALLLALSIIFTLAWYLLDLSPGPVVQNAGVTIFGIGYVGVLGAYAGAILHLPDVGVGTLFVVAWIVTWSDVGGYVIGRKIGRTPLSAASPNKTREGLLAGIGLSVVLSLVISRFVDPFGDSLGASLVFIVVVAAIAPFGDLCESRIKRDLGIKDMGSLIPGHGGVLDRFDAMLVALPISYYLLTVLGLV